MVAPVNRWMNPTMPHKNERALAKLAEFGGDVVRARKHFALADSAAASTAAAMTTLIHQPDGPKRNSALADAKRDDIRAALIAITVYNASAKAGTKMTPPSATEAATLTTTDITAIILHALPARKPTDAFVVTYVEYPTVGSEERRRKFALDAASHPLGMPAKKYDASTNAGSLQQGHTTVRVLLQQWRTEHLAHCTLSAAKPLMAKIFPAGVMADIRDGLKDTAKLCDEIAGTVNAPDRLIVASVNGVVECVGLWGPVAEREEPVGRLHNIVTHPSRFMRLNPTQTPNKSVAAQVVLEIERRAVAADCRTMYLEAGSARVVPFYARLGYVATKTGLTGGFHRQASMALGISAAASTPRDVRPLMVKAIAPPVVHVMEPLMPLLVPVTLGPPLTATGLSTPLLRLL